MSISITCKSHGTDVSSGRCSKCYEENRKAFNLMFAGRSVTTSVPAREQTVLVNGIEAPWYHGNTYLEVDDVPMELSQKINAFIAAEIAAYQAKCGCAQCQKLRIQEDAA